MSQIKDNENQATEPESGEGRTYWRSLKELADSPEYRESVAGEFPIGADLPPDGPSRRDFLQVMAASVGLAGLSGCRWPTENIYPHSKRPPGMLPGIASFYATSMDLAGNAQGLLVKSYEGRPIKVEGNDLHPENQGATDTFAQASLLELYDPDRSRDPIHNDGGHLTHSTWENFFDFANIHFEGLRGQGGVGLHVLSEASSSPSVAAMKKKFLKTFPKAGWHEYEPISRDNEREGAALVFGKPYRTHLSLEQADIVVDLDADILHSHPASLRYARDFAKRRVPEGGEMNRLYSVEGAFSLTGAAADHRFVTPPSQILLVATRLLLELDHLGLTSSTLTSELKAALEKYSENSPETPYVKLLASDLSHHKGRSVITTGPHQPPDVHALVHILNDALGNVGTTVKYAQESDANRPSHLDALSILCGQMAEGSVDTLLVLGGNPVHNAPADLDFAAKLASVKNSIHLSLFVDETSRATTWHVPRSHYLETWGDSRAFDGTLCAVQPLIQPLYGGKSVIELLSALVDDHPVTGYEIVRNNQSFGKDEKAWRTFLDEGVKLGGRAAVQPPLNSDTLIERMVNAPAVSRPSETDLEVIFQSDSSVYDGRFANSGWLQELPDFMTKITWDNAALLSPGTASSLGLDDGDVVSLEIKGRKVELPVYQLPGQAAGTVSVSLGYGRTGAGRVGNGVGSDLYPLRTTEEFHLATGAKIVKTGRTYPLSCTQDHHAIDDVGYHERERRVGELIREGTLDEYEHHPDFAKHRVHVPPALPMWQAHEYTGYKWGMTIDLNKCTGCNACVVACQAENNIPIVGKEQIGKGREMHWLRIDRYFTGDPADPQVASQPVMCVHCENAPCEQVCPVAATMHDRDGLNVMVYNRCIGTRYCSNNCPYKVRRFNFFHYNGDYKAYENDEGKYTTTEKMAFNPDVTVRSRGVMEKCTYCIQRIKKAKITAKNNRLRVQDGEITTACQQVCPSEAIVFGDLNDTSSRVSKLRKNPRSYAMLDMLHLVPRTEYLAKVRNLNPDLNSETTSHGHGDHS